MLHNILFFYEAAATGWKLIDPVIPLIHWDGDHRLKDRDEQHNCDQVLCGTCYAIIIIFFFFNSIASDSGGSTDL